MKLKCLGSGSSGNCYLLTADNGETLILEAGVPASNVFKEVEYDKIIGLLISHQHGDHAGRIKDYLGKSINTYISKECFEGLKIKKKSTLNFFENEKQFEVGQYKILPFRLEHDVPCYGFLIKASGHGNLLFCTDTHSISYNFKNIETLMIETDFDYSILIDNINSGLVNRTLGIRIMNTHLSIDTAISVAKRCKNTLLGNIILLHLSKNNSNSDVFKKRMEEATGCPTYIAQKGLEVKLGLPF
jgi:ribonuclease BN (tRNA processing enzyme)